MVDWKKENIVYASYSVDGKDAMVLKGTSAEQLMTLSCPEKIVVVVLLKSLLLYSSSYKYYWLKWNVVINSFYGVRHVGHDTIKWHFSVNSEFVPLQVKEEKVETTPNLPPVPYYKLVS